MIAILRQLVLSVTAAALFGSILISLTEGRAQQEIVRIAVGLMLVMALVNPLRTIRLPNPSEWLKTQSSDIDGEELYQKAVIEEFSEKLEQYLEKQAENMEIDCTVKVFASDKNREISIDKVRAVLHKTHGKKRIVKMIAAQCGISAEQIEVEVK